MNSFQKYLKEVAKRHHIELDEIVVKTFEDEITVRGVIENSADWFENKENQEMIKSKIDYMEKHNQDIRPVFVSMVEVILYS